PAYGSCIPRSLTFSRNCDHALSWRSFQTLTADCALFWSVSAFRNTSATSSSRARSAPTNPIPKFSVARSSFLSFQQTKSCTSVMIPSATGAPQPPRDCRFFSSIEKKIRCAICRQSCSGGLSPPIFATRRAPPSRPISLHNTPAIRILPRPSNRIRKRFALGSVAQSVEQRPFKALVPGSSPGRPKHTPRPPPDFSSSSSYDAAVPPALSSRAWRNRASVERENGSGARRSWPGALAWSQPPWRCAGLNPPAPFLRARRRELRFRPEPRPRTHQPTLRARHTCNHLSRLAKQSLTGSETHRIVVPTNQFSRIHSKNLRLPAGTK